MPWENSHKCVRMPPPTDDGAGRGVLTRVHAVVTDRTVGLSIPTDARKERKAGL